MARQNLLFLLLSNIMQEKEQDKSCILAGTPAKNIDIADRS